ncbi:hypothetical protein, partial [Agrobacterium cavarae]
DRTDESGKRNQPASLTEAGKLKPPLVQCLGAVQTKANALLPVAVSNGSGVLTPNGHSAPAAAFLRC